MMTSEQQSYCEDVDRLISATQAEMTATLSSALSKLRSELVCLRIDSDTQKKDNEVGGSINPTAFRDEAESLVGGQGVSTGQPVPAPVNEQEQLILDLFQHKRCEKLGAIVEETLSAMHSERDLSWSASHVHLNETGFKAAVLSILLNARRSCGLPLKILSEHELVDVHGKTRYIDLLLELHGEYVVLELKYITANYVSSDQESFSYFLDGKPKRDSVQNWLRYWLEHQAKPYMRGLQYHPEQPKTVLAAIVLCGYGNRIASLSSCDE